MGQKSRVVNTTPQISSVNVQDSEGAPESAQFWLRLDTLEEDKDMSLTPPRPRPLPQPGLLLSLSSWLGLDLSMPASSPAFILPQITVEVIPLKNSWFLISALQGYLLGR